MKKIKNIAEYGKLLHTNKLAIGSGGNISFRDSDYITIKKKGADMSEGNLDDFARVQLIYAESAEEPILSSETPLHVACYRVREDVNAVIHVHSPYIVAAAERTQRLRSNSYESDCYLGEDIPVIDYIQPGSRELAYAVARSISEGADVVILKRHGAITTGSDLEEAYLRVLALERACMTFLLIRGTDAAGN